MKESAEVLIESTENVKASVSKTNIDSTDVLDLKASLNDSQVDLTWETTTTTDIDYFEVEASENGSDFKSIGRVASTNNDMGPPTYEYSDRSPYSGFNYYRVKQCNLNQAITYSDIINIYYADSEILHVYPNPTSNILHITCDIISSSKAATLEVLSISGRRVETVPVNISDHFTTSLDISQLLPGTYILKLLGEDFALYRKFIKE